jgi:hypothetical protein
LSAYRSGRAFAHLSSCLLLALCSTVLEAVPRVDLVSADLAPLIERAAKSPTRFAVDIPHSASTSTAGEWTVSGGSSTWTYSTQIPGAVSMSFHATEALLPDSATLTVTANGVRYVYTANDARGGELWSRIGRGDSLAFELKVATRDVARVRLEIASLQAGYRGFGAGMRNHPRYDKIRIQSLGATAELATCTENWACNTTSVNEGPGQATLALVIGNVGQCSGVLLNDVPGDGAPYVLTARHCQNGNSDGGSPLAAASVRVYWNAISACGAPMGSIYDPGIATQYGAQTVVDQQDAWLIRLNQPPVVDAYYAGWDATGATFVGGFTAHHAIGTSRQFIGWFGQAAWITKPVGSFEGVHYESTLWGTVNAVGNGGGGASGAGMFNELGRLVGTLVRGTDDTDHVGVCPVASPSAPSDSTVTSLSTALSGIFNSTQDPRSTTGAVTIQSVMDPGGTGTQVLDGRKAPITVTMGNYNQSVPTGFPVQLQWSSSLGAQTCTASGGQSGDGWTGSVATTGYKDVTSFIEGDILYKLTCTDGQRTGTASVTLHWTLSLPSVSVSPYPPSEYGVPFTLQWASTVQPCTATGGHAGDGWGGSVAPRGSVSLTETFVGAVTFGLTCGSGARVALGQFTTTFVAPSVGVLADAVTLRLDQPVNIAIDRQGGPCVKTGGAAGDGWAGSISSNYGRFLTVTVNESTPGTYTYGLTCGSGSYVATAQTTVTFVNAAPAASIQASPATGVINLDAITLSWDSNVRPCNVTFDAPQVTGYPLGLQGLPHAMFALQASVIGQYVYTVKCGTGADVVQASTTVSWTGTPQVTMDGATDAVRGSNFSVSYFSNILPCTTSGGIAGDEWAGQQFKDTGQYISIVEQSVGTPTFTVTCGSGGQTAMASRSVNIVAEAPRVALTPDKEVQLKGQPITLTWSSNASPCHLAGGRSGDGWVGNVASSGSMSVTEPASGSYYFSVTCGTGALAATASTVLVYSDFAPPMLTASQGQSPRGQNVTLSWASADGSACVATGGSPTDGWAGNRAASGSVDVKGSSSGYTFFYISCGPSPTVNARVVFFDPPTVKLIAGTSSAPVGEGVALTWGVTYADSCTAAGGNQTDGWVGNLSAFGGTKVIQETASGTYVYSISCVGFSNITASANVSVTMNPAPPPPTTPPAGSGSNGSSSGEAGGGGGAVGPIDIAFYLALGLFVWRQRRADHGARR